MLYGWPLKNPAELNLVLCFSEGKIKIWLKNFLNRRRLQPKTSTITYLSLAPRNVSNKSRFLCLLFHHLQSQGKSINFINTAFISTSCKPLFCWIIARLSCHLATMTVCTPSSEQEMENFSLAAPACCLVCSKPIFLLICLACLTPCVLGRCYWHEVNVSPKYLHLDLISLVDVTEHFGAFRVLGTSSTCIIQKENSLVETKAMLFNFRNKKQKEQQSRRWRGKIWIKMPKPYQLFNTRMDAYTKR